jgi:hypothetical protein
MGQLTQHATAHAVLIEQCGFPIKMVPLRAVDHLYQQQLGVTEFCRTHSHHKIAFAAIALWRWYFQLNAKRLLPVEGTDHQFAKRLKARDEFCNRMANRIAIANREQIFGCSI